ncbi:MAG TPA: IS1595 family transposase [Gemmatimonadaceae bacterium]|jgi:transposase-like protein
MAKHRAAGSAVSKIEAQLPRACSDERVAVEFMEVQRGWTTEANAVCPKCGVIGESYQMKNAKTGERNARYLWRCRACKSQYTVRVGTIMEDSPIPVRHWCRAFYEAAKSKKGVSALEMQRMTGLSYKSALFMMHRIRWAMATANAAEPKLGANGGTVEFDETYIGGKPRGHARYSQTIKSDGTRKLGPGVDFADRKTPVVGGVERDGQIKVRVVMNVSAPELAKEVTALVDPSAHLNTDQAQAYKAIGQQFASHERIRHNAGQYVRYTEEGVQVTTNRIEGFWANLKRQIGGTHHAVSRKHLHRYLSEAEFKYNNRGINDGERTETD